MGNTFQNEIKRTKLAVGLILISFLSMLILSGSFFALKTPSIINALKNNMKQTGLASEGIMTRDSETDIKLTLDEERIANKNKHFGLLDIEAESVLVWDIKKEEAIFEKNADEARPLASITKMMTAVVALEKVEPLFPIFIEHEFLMQHGNSGLFLHESWPLENLIKISMVTSANDASYAIAATVGAHLTGGSHREGEGFFVSEMNRKADSLGLEKTFFHNSTGLDLNERTSGAYSSARDIVELTLYTLLNHPAILYSTRHSVREDVSLSNLQHSFTNTNPTVSETDGIVASKTGYTDLAGGNLVVVVNVDFNYPVIIVVLGSSLNGRFEDIKQLIEVTRHYLQTS